MTKFIQLHTLTVYAPSNLNRDDTGRPKTAKFGGVERLRISSQALKRAIRTSDAFMARVGDNRGERTQRLGVAVRQHLLDKNVPETKATKIARDIAGVFGKIKDENSVDRTGRDTSTYIEQLAFVSQDERANAFAWAERLAADEALPEKLEERAAALLKAADSATDIAMFGRMLASNPDFNREAAVQVAHAITTHKVDVEDDFYTAVDDLKRPSEDAGAGFIGELGFGSGVFYVYACIDRDLLKKNLGEDEALTQTAIAAFVEGLATSSPTGKQASFASRARASYLRVEKGPQQPRSLAAAFLRPVRDEDLLKGSIDRIEHGETGLVAQMHKAYGPCFDHVKTMRFIAGETDGNEGSLPELISFAAAE